MKRYVTSMKAIIAVFLALILSLLVGVAALRNPYRIDLSTRNFYRLSNRTIQLLEQLDRDVRITVFFQEEDFLFDDIDNLLEEYEYRSRYIEVDWVDPMRDVAETEKLASKFGVKPSQLVVVEMDGRSQVLHMSDLAVMQSVPGRDEPIMTAFKGEQAFSSAIQKLSEGKTPVVYFLLGHGEHRLGDFDPQVGYSDIATAMLSDNIQGEDLILSSEQGIPENAAAVVIAGPTQKMSATEVAMIEDYLSRSGRLFVLLDALVDTGMEGMLRRWGVVLHNDIVIDMENTLRGEDVHIRRFNPDHQISGTMGAIVQFILPRSVEPPLDENGMLIVEDELQLIDPLCSTSEKSWAETQLSDSAPPKYDPDTADRLGPIFLGLAVERGAAQDQLDVQIDPSRMVVIGDSDFVSNGNMVLGNSRLFMNSMNWLLDRDEKLPIAPKPVEKVRLGLTMGQLRMMGWINLAAIPGIAVGLGLLIWSRRRK
ncbi:MAG: GldG family protein [Pontiellaceae bacterium]|nr:GldG family protein [Pontiellaceae bacterium]MBN2784406.1 GldG family protein [Pontiellaceae bacterium]